MITLNIKEIKKEMAQIEQHIKEMNEEFESNPLNGALHARIVAQRVLYGELLDLLQEAELREAGA